MAGRNYKPSPDTQKYLTAVNRDVLHQPLYDAVRFTATIAAGFNQTFFATPVGQGTGIGGGAKTELDTNMRLAGQVPRDHVFEVHSPRIMVAFDDVSSATIPSINQQADILNDIMHGSFLRIRIVSAEKLLVPTWFLPGGSGIYGGVNQGFQAAAASFQTQAVSHGHPSQMAAKALCYPIVIPPLQVFEVSMSFVRAVTFSAAVGGIIIWVLFDGILYRPAMP